MIEAVETARCEPAYLPRRLWRWVVVVGVLLSASRGVVLGQAGLIQERDRQQRAQQEQDRLLRERLERQGETPIVDQRATPPATPEPPAVRFQLNKVEISPSAILAEAEIRSVLADYEGREVSMADLQEMLARLNALYAAKKIVTAQAFLPKQKVKDGVLRVDLVEARLGSVVYEGNRHTRESYLRRRLDFPSGELVDIGTTEEKLARFNRLNDAQAQVSLQAGQAPGTTDYKVTLHEPPQYQVDAFSDNYSPDSAGDLRGGSNLRLASVFGLRDPLSVGAYATERTTATYAAYEIPITPYDTRLGISFDFNDTDVEIAGALTNVYVNGVQQRGPGLSTQSRSYYGGMQISHPLLASARWLVRGFVEGSIRESGFSIERFDLPDTDLRGIYGGISGDWIDSFGSTSFSHRFGRVFYLHDIGGEANPDFYKYQGWIARNQPMSRLVWASARLSGQVTSSDIPQAEAITAGGGTSVRGYPEIYRIGDDGYVMSLQINALLPRSEKILQADRGAVGGFLFVDHAALFTGFDRVVKIDAGHSRTRHSIEESYLASTGAGVFMNWNEYASLQIAVGLPLSERSDISDAQAHFALHITPPVNSWIGG